MDVSDRMSQHIRTILNRPNGLERAGLTRERSDPILPARTARIALAVSFVDFPVLRHCRAELAEIGCFACEDAVGTYAWPVATLCDVRIKGGQPRRGG